MTFQSKIIFTLGFFSALLAYSWKGLSIQCFDCIIAFVFVCYTRVIYLQSHGIWSLMAFIVWLTTVSSLLDELFFDPTKFDINEYIGFALTIIVTYIFKTKWIRSKKQ
jgi:hypothetical protein